MFNISITAAVAKLVKAWWETAQKTDWVGGGITSCIIRAAPLTAADRYQQTPKQCCEKLKTLKSDYQPIKDQNGWCGSNRTNWKGFDQMDSICRQ
ncbi:hypothetical protein ATANTOWER_031644 [Ataeniobius toweri]|uniref:Myb/SANT-like DNA-binding domain-containing protein n=1 Tax=Ataeniobius toweri TaxID=208326 RepID=A0ABU7ALT8_9TELE|nr:hypothetical protein [Ataeniobius toweri]